MYQLIAFDGSHILSCKDFEQALRLLRSIPRASQVWTDDGVVLLAWKPRGNMESIAAVGRDAGSPTEFDCAAGMN